MSDKSIMWKNAYEIARLVEYCKEHAVLGPATRFLDLLVEHTDANSDGWAHWQIPSDAARPLVEFIDRHTDLLSRPLRKTEPSDLKELLPLITPIKRMATLQRKKQKSYGNTYVLDVEKLMQKAGILTKQRSA